MNSIYVSSRIIIREHMNSDLLELHGLISCPKNMRYLPGTMTKTIEESQHNLNHAIEQSTLQDRRDFFYALTLPDGRYVGEIGITTVIESRQGKVGNLGYFIRKEYWGKGITTEAAKFIIDFSFENYSFVKIESGCLKENVASEKVMVKCGMRKEGDLGMHVLHEGLLKDRLEYGLTREEWKKNHLTFRST